MGTQGKHRNRLLYAIIIPSIVGFGLLIGIPTAHAADSPQFGIRPANPDTAGGGYFTLKGDLGQTLSDAIVVANPGTVPIKILLYAVDAISGQNGGAIYLNSQDRRTDVGAWITLEQTSIEVPPQKQTIVNFTITLPKETRAGQHLGGIAAQLVQGGTATALAPGQQNSGFGITTVTRALTAVLVNIGGEQGLPSLRITGAQVADVDGLPTLTLALQNDGTSLLKAQGEVTMLDATGKQVLSSKLALDTLVPQTSISYPVQADPPSLPGAYKVHVTLDFGGTAPAVFDGSITVMVAPTATVPATGRTRPTAVAGNPAPAAAPAANSGSISPMVILGGIAGALAVLVIGLTVFVIRSRHQKATPQAYDPSQPPPKKRP